MTRTIERAQWDAVSFKKHLEHLLTLLGPAAELPAGKDSADVLEWLSDALHKTGTFLNHNRWASIARCVEDTLGCVGSALPQTVTQDARDECRALEPLLEAIEAEITCLASTVRVPGPR